MMIKRIKTYFISKLPIILIMFYSFSYGQNSRKLDSAFYYYKRAQQFDYQNKHYRAYKNYIKSLNFYKKLELDDSIAKCNLELFDLITSQSNFEDNSKSYLDAYYDYTLKKNDSFMLLKATNRYAQYFWDMDTIEVARKFYKKSLQITNNKKFEKYKVGIYTNLAFLYTKTKPDSAKFYYEKTLNLSSSLTDTQLLGTYINYGVFLKNQRKYLQAILQLKKAEKIKLDKYQLKYNKIIFRNFANYYKLLGNYKEAYKYYEKYNVCLDSLNNTAQNIAISDLDKKYKTAEKDKLIAETKAKNKQNSLLFIIASLLLILGTVIYILSYKNTKRKQKLAEQEKELETQKNLTLIKEQEITTINAMVDGQEKERKRIAEELHDNLGSVLATLKLHFDNLKINREKKKINQEELFDKTEILIDEAYSKVRSIAHAKNAGVIANQGLLIAIKMMAEKISSSDKIKIEVVDFGLHKRLENSLEISVFRIIQELITNIIKHANAKNVSINISLYQEMLNIIVEDDGKGFSIEKIDLKNGMGISSVQTRINHQKGTFEIDSTLFKGTTIIINIPVT